MKQKLMHFLLPMLLGIAVMSSIAYCYAAAYAMPITIGLVGIEAATFFVLHKIYNMRHKKLSGLVYMALLLAVGFVTLNMLEVASRGANTRFYAWFFGVSQKMEVGYTLVLCFGGGFVFFSMLYYFTQVRYRGIMTLMLVLFPFAIYAKRLDAMKTEYLIAILFCYLAVMVHNRQTAADSGVTVVADRAYAVSLVSFAAVVVLLCAVIPKPEVLSIQEKDADYFNSLQIFELEGTTVTLDSSNFVERLRGTPSGTELFYVYPQSGDTQVYLKTQSYGYFDDNGWYYGEDKYPKIEYVWNNPAYMLQNMRLEGKLKILHSYFSENEGYEKELRAVEKAMSLRYEKKLFVSMAEGISFDMYMVPQFTYYLDKFDQHAKSAYDVTLNGEYHNYSRTSGYYRASYEDVNMMRELASELSLTDDEWELILSWYDEMAWLYPESYSEEISNAVSSEKDFAETFHNGEYDNFDSRISELAKEITKDCKTDFEKARALESYFTKEGYKYDLEYYPPDESIEYFIFDSKTGICSDFATAMTLMARSVGLNARYAHGYLAFEPIEDESEGFVVRDSYAHAFVEVYINGIGWMTFEPTVPGFEQQMYNENAGSNAIVNVLSDKLTWIILGIVILAGLAVIIFIRPICEGAYRIYVVSLSKKDSTLASMKLYRHMVKRVSKRLRKDLSAFTAKQICELLSDFDLSAKAITECFDKAFYGGKSVTNEEFQTALAEYKLIYKIKPVNK